MNPLKTIHSFEKFMAANVEKSEKDIANELFSHARCGTKFICIVDLVRAYKQLCQRS